MSLDLLSYWTTGAGVPASIGDIFLTPVTFRSGEAGETAGTVATAGAAETVGTKTTGGL